MEMDLKKPVDAFSLFRDQWALVSAGNETEHNACTVSWGSFGTLWTRSNVSGQCVTVYLHPVRYTSAFLMQQEVFTVSFFPAKYKKALAYLGTHSGREGDKISAVGLTPIFSGEAPVFEEAELTFVCKKLYAGPFDKRGIDPLVAAYYEANPKLYPLDEEGVWQPHIVFVGEIIDIVDRR